MNEELIANKTEAPAKTAVVTIPLSAIRRIIHARPHLPGISDWPIYHHPGRAPATTGIPVILGRKGAFGSGENETTIACLEELAKVAGISGATVLDLGSGTGILAIAAARLGAACTVALDNDLPAAISCAANVRLNGLRGSMKSPVWPLNLSTSSWWPMDSLPQ